MQGKSKRKTRQRRRDQYISLHAMHNGTTDITRLVDEARRRGKSGKEKVQRDEEANAVAESAIKTADQVTELYLTNLSTDTLAIDVVKALHAALYSVDVIPSEYIFKVCQISEPFPESPVLRCEIRKPKDNQSFLKPRTAYVSIRNKNYADHLIDYAPLIIKESLVPIELCKRPLLPGVGSAWRSRRDPGTESWRVGMVQFGEKISDNVFSTFWASSQFFDLSENCHVELNPVERIIGLIIASPQRMLISKSIYSDFKETESIMRIEIPFRDISRPPCVERNPDSKQDCAVYFPISRPPFLFRAEDTSILSDPDVNRDYMWDCSQDAFESIRWTRTVDPTRHEAFSRATGFRIMLGSNDTNALFENLYKLCISNSSRPFPIPGTFQIEKRHPNRHIIFQRAVTMFNIPFSVRYMMECILSLGTISLTRINREFWHCLSFGISERDALATLDFMFFKLSEQNNSRLQGDFQIYIHDPVTILQECMDICNVTRDPNRKQRGFPSSAQTEQNQAKSIAGIYVDDTSAEKFSDEDEDMDEEEIVMDEVFQRLTTEDFAFRKGDGKKSPTSVQTHDLIQSTKIRLPSRQHALIRRLLFTPTRVVAQPPETDLLNRVLREFYLHHDRFLRISFCDEDGTSIGYSGSDDLYTRIRKILREGVEAAGEKFVFLAFSNSQLRDHAVWMYNETPSRHSTGPRPPTADQIRAWMGDFSKIRIPGKFAARQGQTFSSTVGTVLLDDVQQRVVNDIYDESRNYMFSDGVGLMSSELARKVAEKLRLTGRDSTPSAFQVRFGGAKGMLTVWDDAFPRVANVKPGKIEVILRESMKKFECSHKALEIVGYSKRLPLFLNRQIICLLSGLGVPDEIFERLQNKVLRQLDQAMQENGAADALHLLYTSGALDNGVKLSMNASSINTADFFRAGLTCVTCEHLFNVMYAYRRRMIRDLMLRARIPIDCNKGVCCIGIMDELNILKPGEIFCQYTLPDTGKLKIVQGRVTVGRSPCLHPGDIQPLRGVDHKQLRGLKDVIVFPQRGRRPIPSMLSGGDLDGDIYFIIFDETIPFPQTCGYQPMTYVAPRPVTLPRPVTNSDIADFFVEYIRNDKLGVIANAHVVYSDKDENGITAKKCVQLAELHSVAVDFAKTGVPARIPNDLLPRNVRNQYPDFMGKHPKVSYISKKVLGKLYRSCKTCNGRDRNIFEDIEFVPNEGSKRLDQIMDSFQEEQEMKVEAEKLCAAYNVEIIRLMEQFGVRTEGEVVSGYVVTFTERHAQLRGRREHFALQMRLNRQMSELRSQFRDLFFKDLKLEQVSGDGASDLSVETIIKASAWYKACRKIALAEKGSRNPHFVSFPWVVSDVLLTVIGNELRKERQWGSNP